MSGTIFSITTESRNYPFDLVVESIRTGESIFPSLASTQRTETN